MLLFGEGWELGWVVGSMWSVGVGVDGVTE